VEENTLIKNNLSTLRYDRQDLSTPDESVLRSPTKDESGYLSALSLGQTGDRQVSRLEETKMKNVLGMYRLVNMFLNSFLPVPEAGHSGITNSYFRVCSCDSWADELDKYTTLLLKIKREFENDYYFSDYWNNCPCSRNSSVGCA